VPGTKFSRRRVALFLADIALILVAFDLSLRVRMGGWCAYFTMLSREQQEHHIRRQEARS